MSEFRTIGVVVKTDAKAASSTLAQLLADLRARGLTTLLDQASARLAPEQASVPRAELGRQCDLIIVIGGDGTLLHTGREVAAGGVPLLGVNLGRLGFMVDIAPDQLSQSLGRILDGEYAIEERLILAASSAAQPERQHLAINDVVVRHRRYVRMLEFSTHANGTFISQHRADGIIVSTPTGSTAYALSSGGPMMHPDLAAIALVPISPHTLSDRPLILAGDTRLEVEIVDHPDNAALFTCDGQFNVELEPGDRLLVQRSPHRMRLVHPPEHDYFSILRGKLHWGRGRDH